MIEKITTGSFETNTYIISKENKCIIVDPGLDFFSCAESIKQKYEVVAIFLTHGHLDHIDGIRFFECPIYLSENEKEFLTDDSLNLYKMMGKKSLFQLNNEIHYLVDGEKIELIGEEFEVISTPGHTCGSICFYYRHKLISGDTLFYESVGRSDFPTGNGKKLKYSIQKLFEKFPDDTKVYPGHGEYTTLKHEKKFNPFI